MAGAGYLGGYVPAHACKCGNTQFGGTFGYDSPSPAQFTAAHMRDFATAHGLACYEAGSAAAAQAVPEAMKIVCDAMRADPEYAWSWHCNIAMAFVDEGGNHAVGNHAAARFLRSLADVEPAHELPPRFELSDERIMQYLGPWHIQGDTDDRADLIQCVRAMIAAAPTQGAEGAAPQAEADDNRTFGLTLEGKDGRQVEVRWTRSQVDELVRILRAQGLIPAPEKTAALSATIKSALGTFEMICNYCDSADLAQHIVEEIGSTCDELREALTPSPIPTALQEADALREALAELVACKDLKEQLEVMSSDTDPAEDCHWFKTEYERRKPLAWAAARAALAQHQPQQGEGA